MASEGGEPDDDECENITVSISPEQWAHFVDQRRVPGGPDNQSVYSACVDIKVYYISMARRLSADLLPRLYSYLSPLVPASSPIQGMVQSVIDGKTGQRFWVDTWPDPKAVVITPVKEVAFLSNEYWMFTMDQSALKYLLDREGVVDWETSVIFAVITRDDIHILEEVANKHGCRVDLVYSERSDVYYADKDTLQLVDTPMGLKLRELSCEQAQIVNDTWKYNCGNVTLAYFEFLIKNYPSLGLFDDKVNLLAFELTTHYGSMGSLYVLPEHLRKGYASCVISALAQRTLAAGRTPFVFMDQHNDISICLHRKMGFKKANFGLVSWIRIETKQCGSSSKPTECCV